MLTLLSLSLSLLPLTPAVPQGKPPVPQNGFALLENVDNIVDYSDGYRAYGDLIYPDPAFEPVPGNGWPLIVYVHGLGGNRNDGRTDHRDLAARGFAVWAYDVRGQGDTAILNPPGMTELSFYGPDEKMDFAHQVDHVHLNFDNIVDVDLLGITGTSQGGNHSWAGAAYSGATITHPTRPDIGFPTVDAVLPQHMIADIADLFVEDGTMFGHGMLRRLYAPGAWIPDPAFIARWRSFWDNQDPVGFAANLAGEAGRPIKPGLTNTQVPILYQHAYHDQALSPHNSIAVIPTVNSTIRTHLSTIGHDSPFNVYESAFQKEMRVRWFDHYLWGINNEVDLESPFLLGIMPVANPLLFNPNYLWGFRDESSTSVVSTPTTFYLTDSGGLANSPPITLGTPTTIVHDVAAGFGPTQYIASPSAWSLTNTLAKIPMSERSFTAAPLAAAQELVGETKLRLRVTPDAENFILAALLLVRIPESSSDFMIASGGTGTLGATPGADTDVEITIHVSDVVLPAGSVLKILIRNHWIKEAPMPRGLVTTPYFDDVNIDVQHGPGVNASSVELPLRTPRVGLVSPQATTNVASPQMLNFTVRGDASRADKPYVILGSLSGHVPGIPLPGGVVPVQNDEVTRFLINRLGTSLVPGFRGFLNANGVANATFDLPQLAPLAPSLAGARLSFAVWVYESEMNLTGEASNPVDVIFR